MTINREKLINEHAWPDVLAHTGAEAYDQITADEAVAALVDAGWRPPEVVDHLRSELGGMSDMATRTRDFNARQFEALHRAISEAIGYEPGAPWPGNAKAFADLAALDYSKAEVPDPDLVDDLVEFWHTRSFGKLLDDAARDWLRSHGLLSKAEVPEAEDETVGIEVFASNQHGTWVSCTRYDEDQRQAAEAHAWRLHESGDWASVEIRPVPADGEPS